MGNGTGAMGKRLAIDKLRWGLLAGAVVLSMSACGYRFSGTGELPGGVSRISVAMFDNRTAQSGIESTFTNDLIYEISRSGRAAVAEREKADAVLSGEIRSLRVTSIARQNVLTTAERRVTVTVDAKLSNSGGEIIWSAFGLTAQEDYLVASSKQQTERNKEAAIELASKRIAERIYNRLTDNF